MNNIRNEDKRSEVIFWSIALPGFGQFLNGKYFKAFILVFLEVIINVKGNINIVIMNSFLGEMEEAISQANFLWLLFYPCVYLFAIWDAYRDAGGGEHPFIYLPFVFSAYFGTLGVIYSVRLRIFGYLIGPIFLPIISMITGFLIGFAIRHLIQRQKIKKGES